MTPGMRPFLFRSFVLWLLFFKLLCYATMSICYLWLTFSFHYYSTVIELTLSCVVFTSIEIVTHFPCCYCIHASFLQRSAMFKKNLKFKSFVLTSRFPYSLSLSLSLSVSLTHSHINTNAHKHKTPCLLLFHTHKHALSSSFYAFFPSLYSFFNAFAISSVKYLKKEEIRYKKIKLKWEIKSSLYRLKSRKFSGRVFWT